MKRRAVGFLIALALCLSLCPIQVLAADDGYPGSIQTSTIYEETDRPTTDLITDALKFDTNGYRYTVSASPAMSVRSSGMLYLTKGTIKSTKGVGIEVQSGGFLSVSDPDMNVIGTTYGLDIASGGTARLSGGTFTGDTAAIQAANHSALLASSGGTYYAYFDASGRPVPLTNVGGQKTVKVKECTAHEYNYTAIGSAAKHDRTCKYCGAKADPESCTFSFGESNSAKCDKCSHTLEITVNPGDLVYNDTDKAANVTVTVKLDGSEIDRSNYSYTVEPSPRTDVGDFTVTVKGVTYSGTYTETFSVSQAQPVITWDTDQPVPVKVYYNGKPVDKDVLPSVIISPDHAVSQREHLYYSYREQNTGSDYTVGLPTDVGTYDVIASLPGTQNYEAASSDPITLKITKINPILEPPAAIKPTYNGTKQKLVTGGTVNPDAVGAVILFATSQDGTYSETIPTATRADDYVVWYKVEEADNYSGVTATQISDVKIVRKEITPVVTLGYTSHPYTGGELQPAVTVSDRDGTVLPVTEYEVKYSGNIDVGTATVTVTDKAEGNYKILEALATFKITPSDQAALTITGQPDTVTYGDQFTLGTYGGSGSGAVAWAIDGGTDSADGTENVTAFAKINKKSGQVTVTGVGPFTVVATKSGGNYKETTAECSFTSVKKEVTATVTASNKTYDGTATATVTAEVEQGVVSGDTIAITMPNGTFFDANAGTGKTVTVTINGTAVTVQVNGHGKNETAVFDSAENYFYTDNYIITIPGTTRADITRTVTIITTAPTAADLTYDHSKGAQALLSAAADTGTATPVDTNAENIVVEYALNKDGPYSTNYKFPTATNAGDYEVWYRVQDTGNYFGTDAKRMVVTIKPKEITPDVTLGLGKMRDKNGVDYYYCVYDGNAQEPSVTVTYQERKDGEEAETTVTIPSSEYTVAYKDNVNVGTATVTVTDKAGGNYTVGEKTVTFSITKGEKATLTSSPKAVENLTYNGQGQSLVEVGTASGGHLVYALAKTNDDTAGEAGDAPADDDYQDAVPRRTDAGEYKVYYKVKGDGNHQDTDPDYLFVTISPKTVANPVIQFEVKGDNPGEVKYSDTYSAEYEENHYHEPRVIVKDGSVTVDQKEYTLSYSSNLNAGTATVRITDNRDGNYTISGSTTFEIEKATAKFGTQPTPNGEPGSDGKYVLPYKGKPLELVTPGVAALPGEGTVVYALDSGEFGTAIPTATARGSYTVRAKVQGNENYKDSVPVEIQVAIGINQAANLTAELSSTKFTYNGSEHTPEITVKDGGDVISADEYDVTYFRVADGGSDAAPVEQRPIAAGTYQIKIKARTAGNYSFQPYTVIQTFEILPADSPELKIIGKPSFACYGDTINLNTVSVTGGPEDGTVTWSIEEGKGFADLDGATNILTITDVGVIELMATSTSRSGNYTNKTDTWRIEAKPKPITATVTASDRPYDNTDEATIQVTWSGAFVGNDENSIVAAGTFDGVNAGLHTVTVTFSGEASHKYAITIMPETVTATITQARAEWAAGGKPTPASGPIYAGSGDTPLVKPGTTVNNIGTVTYALAGPIADPDAHTYAGGIVVGDDDDVIIDGNDDIPNIVIPDDDEDGPAYSEYKEEVPTADTITKPGTYRIWFRVADDGSEYKNWEGISPEYIEVTIIEAPDNTGSTTDPTPGQTSGSGTSSTPSATGSGTETASTQTTVKDGVASTVVSGAAGNKLADEAVASRSGNVVIKPEITSDVTKAEVSIPASAVSRIGKETDASLTVSTPIADVTIPNGALSALSNAGGTVSVAAEQVDNTVVLTLTANGKAVRDIPGGLTLTVPVEDAGPGTVAVLVYEDGTREIIRKSVADDSGVRIPLNGSATVEIVDNSKEFEDVPAESWAADAVAFASAHEMFNGTGETTFSPELSMSRAMLATVLYNLESNPDTAFNGAFADVEGDAWYAESVSWAASRGIVTGYGDGSFGANNSITREQLAVMLWRYAGSPTAGGETLNFTDAGQASGYAMEALAWAAANGILNGYGDGRIDPTGLATRAQAAQMLKNFMENT